AGRMSFEGQKASTEHRKLDGQIVGVADGVEQVATPANELPQSTDGETSMEVSSAVNQPANVFVGVSDSNWTAGGIALAGAGLVGFLAAGTSGESRTANSRRKALGVQPT